jgi:predicted metalloendopeptidase
MTHFGDNVVSFFKKAAVKLEEFQVQTSLGLADASYQFEALKKEALEQYSQIKADVIALLKNDNEQFNHLKAKFEHLELQLALGKAETLEMLEEQKKNVQAAIADIKRIIEKD